MVTTGADGRFSFKQVNAGTFRITVASTGFARQEYGQRTVNGPGTPINLTAGSTVQDLTIHLTPTGTVSGRISDELGQPAVDVPVQLVRVAFSPQGKTFQAVGSTNVNDRGEYRLTAAANGLAGTLTTELYGNCWNWAAGHVMQLQVTQTDNPYLRPDNLPSQLTLSNPHFDVPTAEANTVSLATT